MPTTEQDEMSLSTPERTVSKAKNLNLYLLLDEFFNTFAGVLSGELIEWHAIPAELYSEVIKDCEPA
jgi:hypothetical protein